MKVRIIVIVCIFVCFAFVAGYFLKSSTVSDHARIAAFKALQNNLGRQLERGTLLIVDFTKPSQSKRFAVINIETGTILFSAKVAHGKNSGVVYASKVSNDIGSLQSSAGLFEIAESFNGKKGPSLRLKGLEPHLNSNAEIRGIIIHAAAYVSWKAILLNWREKFRLGRSEGCFALSNTDFKKLIANLDRPAYLYTYHNHVKL